MPTNQKLFIPQKLRPWIEARRRFHLSHAQVQMARELGMNPKKLGKLDNHKQERWKLPLPLFIEECYRKRFGKERPDDSRPLEARIAEKAAKKGAKKLAGQQISESPASQAKATSERQTCAPQSNVCPPLHFGSDLVSPDSLSH